MKTKQIRDLSEALRPIVEYEIERGNQIARIDRPAGSDCPLALIFNGPLDIRGYVNEHGMSDDVETWKNLDRHYPLEEGVVCKRTHQAVAGPMRK